MASAVKPEEEELYMNELAESRAQEIILAGETYPHMVRVWQRRHYGDLVAGKILILSCGCGSIKNAKGFHVWLCGPSGIGKSDSAQKGAELVDPAYLLDSTVTPQVLFYPTESFIDGSIVFVDDMVWNSELGANIKKITTKFQEGAMRTVTTEGTGTKYRSRKRLVFWITSVDSHADEQIRDRFILVDIDESPKHLEKAMESLKDFDMGVCISEEMEFETRVCRALIRDLRNNLKEVVIPFADRIEFKGDLRAYRIFGDMIRCFAIFSYAKRSSDEHGRLIATEEDFMEAKSLYEEFGGHSADKYTTSELKLIRAIIDNGYEATQEDLQRIADLSVSRVSDILNGRKDEEQQKHGLLYKCSKLIVNRDRKPYKYKLPQGYDPTADRKNLVSLRPT